MTRILNIGLDCTGAHTLSPARVLRVLRAAGLRVIRHALHDSDTELTVVAEVDAGYSYVPFAERIRQIAVTLGQECIAVLDTSTGRGSLHGPNATGWGDFNPEFFIQLDGTRLAQPATV